ncbi:hypothetical protein LG284_14205 [Citricoccus nitrophenolicus]
MADRAERETWNGIVRDRCLRCGGGNVSHGYMGMPSPELASGAPEWVGWSCVFEGPDRYCSDCAFRWFAPGSTVGFRNVWEVFARYGVDSLYGLGDYFSALYSPDVHFDLHADESGIPAREALEVIVGTRGEYLQFPFLDEQLEDVIDELVDDLTDGDEA